jgi:hypothetical protein
MNDDALRAAYRELLEAPREGRSGCPPPETLEALAARRGPEAARLATLNHAMSCADCRRELELLWAVARAAPPPARISPAFALAAVLMLSVGAVLLWQSLSAPGLDTLRGPDSGVALVEPAADARIPGTARFVWRSMTDAESYRLEVSTASGELAGAWTTTDTIFTLPANRLAPADSAYRWRVVAELRGGGTVPSGFRRLTLTSP